MRERNRKRGYYGCGKYGHYLRNGYGGKEVDIKDGGQTLHEFMYVNG